MLRSPIIYGAVTAFAIWFVGWSTGMGGGFLPNLVFALMMGLLAGVLFMIVQKFAKPREK